jgi:uncharacterized protein (DUF302 family)
MNANGIINLQSKHSVADTAIKLEALLKNKGLKIFAHIDQAAEAKSAGLAMRPTVMFIFGDPNAGTPLMNRHPSLALDLPLKALIWESADGAVWLSYNSPEYLQQRHGLETAPFGPVANLLQAAIA